MDKEKRSRLKKVVSQARTIIESDVRAQLRRLGVNEDGSYRPLRELTFLSRDEMKLRGKVLQAIDKEKAGDIAPKEALDRYVRHVGFTYINRIAALRAMEVRGLIKETVIRRSRYGGMSRREYEIAEDHKEYSSDEVLKASLLQAVEKVSSEIKVLFDVNDEYSLIFPQPKPLRDLIWLFSEEVPEEDWKEDDIIGWIYQYYNEDARAEFKKARRKPRADDIPVINQFYTPRWVVRALVDNTLGRLWLEANNRCPMLGDPLTRSKEQLKIPSGDTVNEFCSYLVPLSQKPPPRMKKSVREIKVLDPACGSGHFLVYAFGVLYRMYREDEPETPEHEIPNLILENNLFGIDIDLRAVQLAALSLYLKAKQYNPKLKIKKMNLVCADARITDGAIRREFLDVFSNDPDLQRIFARLFKNLNYTYEIGSLLKVRQPFERLLAERRRAGGIQATFALLGQTELSETGRLRGQSIFMKVRSASEVSAIPIVTPQSTIEEMLEALMEFEKEAMEKRDMGTMLFASEVEKSVGLLAILSQMYDVVLMNPAYGPMPSKTKEYAKKHYPRTKNDYYAAFIEQAIDLTEKNGFVGMLTSRTFMFLRTFQKLREDVLWNEGIPELLLDTGFGVLDGAIVETAATVVRKIMSAVLLRPVQDSECTFCRLAIFDTYEKEKAFMGSLLTYLEKGEHELWYRTTFGDLAKVPLTAYAYWASPSLRELFEKYPPLDKDLAGKPNLPKIAYLKQGLSPADSPRFKRQFWEILPEDIGKGKKFVPHPMGGGYAKFYADIDLVVEWENNGKEIKAYPNAYVRNEPFYFKEGLTWTLKPAGPLKAYIAVRYLPENVIFSVAGHGCFPKINKWVLMSFVVSKLSYFLCSIIASEHNWVASVLASLPIAYNKPEFNKLELFSRESYALLKEWNRGNEISTIFIKPWILQILHGFDPEEKPITDHPFAKQFSWSDWGSLKEIRSIIGNKEMNLREIAALVLKREGMMQKRLEELQRQIDETVYHLYEISEEDKNLIKKEIALRHGESPFLEEETEESEEEEDHVARLISFYIKKTFESDPDGIIPLHELVQKIRKNVANDFGEDQVDFRESEVEEILGKNLEEWIATEYFDFHVNLYKRRPIVWHLTSSNFARGRGIGAFNCLLHYHKLNRDTIPKVRVNYLRNEIDRAKRTVDRLRRELQKAKDAKDRSRERRLSRDYENAFAVLEELQKFDEALETIHNPRRQRTKLGRWARWVDKAIAEVRDNGWNPIIDYGVRVNIEPLKEARVLHKAADRVK